MFNKVIVGVDASQGSRDAITLACQLVNPSGELVLTRLSDGPSLSSRAVVGRRIARDKAENLLLQLAGESGNARTRAVAATAGSRELHRLLEREHADLLVLGAGRKGFFQTVLAGAPCAVAVAPPGYGLSTSVIAEVGVGFDGSDESFNALEVARRLAAEQHATLSAFHGLGLPEYLVDGTGRDYEAVVKDSLNDAKREIEELGDVKSHAGYGDPVDELIFYSAAVDLLVLGSRGYGPIGRLAHGSMTIDLARSSRCPLLALVTSGSRRHAPGVSSRVVQAPLEQPLALSDSNPQHRKLTTNPWNPNCVSS